MEKTLKSLYIFLNVLSLQYVKARMKTRFGELLAGKKKCSKKTILFFLLEMSVLLLTARLIYTSLLVLFCVGIQVLCYQRVTKCL